MAIQFDGVNQKLEFAPGGGKPAEFTISAWLNFADNNSQFVCCNGNGSNGYTCWGLVFDSVSGYDNVHLYSSSGTPGSGALVELDAPFDYATGEWHHYAVTYLSGGNTLYYIDGVLITTIASVGTQAGLAYNFVLAYSTILGSGSGYSGLSVADFQLHSGTGAQLDITTINSIMNGHGTVTNAGTIDTWYPFLTETGTCTTETDSSGGGHTGTASNSPSYVSNPFVFKTYNQLILI